MTNPNAERLIVRYWAPVLQQMKVCGLLGLGFMCGPIVLYRTQGVASHGTATIALWIWGVLGLPCGLLLITFSVWAFRRSIDGRIALEVTDDAVRITPIFLPCVELKHDQILRSPIAKHQSSHGLHSSIYIVPKNPDLVISTLPIHLRWWVRATAAMAPSLLTLPGALIDTPLKIISEVLWEKEMKALMANRVFQNGPPTKEPEFTDYFSEGPIGYWDSAGFAAAPTNRVAYFEDDGSAWLHIDFSGPEYEFRWESSGPFKITIWFEGDPAVTHQLIYHITDQKIRFTYLGSLPETQTNLCELLLDLSIEAMSYSGPPKSSPSSS